MKSTVRTFLLIAVAGSLSGCLSGILGEDIPQAESSLVYAEEVCDEAGSRTQSCIDARRQINLRCYRTIGTVDCYNEPEPFGPTPVTYIAAQPIDRRRPLPPPPPPEPEKKPLAVSALQMMKQAKAPPTGPAFENDTAEKPAETAAFAPAMPKPAAPGTFEPLPEPAASGETVPLPPPRPRAAPARSAIDG